VFDFSGVAFLGSGELDKIAGDSEKSNEFGAEN
jgi:hypothetical protein